MSDIPDAIELLRISTDQPAYKQRLENAKKELSDFFDIYENEITESAKNGKRSFMGHSELRYPKLVKQLAAERGYRLMYNGNKMVAIWWDNEALMRTKFSAQYLHERSAKVRALDADKKALIVQTELSMILTTHGENILKAADNGHFAITLNIPGLMYPAEICKLLRTEYGYWSASHHQEHGICMLKIQWDPVDMNE